MLLAPFHEKSFKNQVNTIEESNIYKSKYISLINRSQFAAGTTNFGYHYKRLTLADNVKCLLDCEIQAQLPGVCLKIAVPWPFR